MRNRLIGFLVWLALVIAIFAIPLSRLIRQSLGEGYSSHIVLIPILVIYLIWSQRKAIFRSISTPRGRTAQIICAVIACAALWAIFFRSHVPSNLAPLTTVFCALVLIITGFWMMFGTKALRQAAFPLSLLALMLPIPDFLINRIIVFLQSGSASLSAWMFSMLGVPVLRDGFVLTIPGISIEVATECSGINSSIALLIIMLLVAHETLQTTWRRALLVLITIPLSIVKNAIRIVTLTMLASRVDPGFLTGKLHHEGGFVFFLISLALVYPVWKLLARTEQRRSPRAIAAGANIP